MPAVVEILPKFKLIHKLESLPDQQPFLLGDFDEFDELVLPLEHCQEMLMVVLNEQKLSAVAAFVDELHIAKQLIERHADRFVVG